MFSEEEIIADAQNYGKNVEYVTHELIKTDNWEGYQVVYSFDDITKVRISPDPDSKVDIEGDAAENGEEEEYYFFKFVKGDTPQLIIDRPEIELSGETESNDSEASEQNDEEGEDEFLKVMEGMKIDISVEVDGEIVNSLMLPMFRDQSYSFSDGFQ